MRCLQVPALGAELKLLTVWDIRQDFSCALQPFNDHSICLTKERQTTFSLQDVSAACYLTEMTNYVTEALTAAMSPYLFDSSVCHHARILKTVLLHAARPVGAPALLASTALQSMTAGGPDWHQLRSSGECCRHRRAEKRPGTSRPSRRACTPDFCAATLSMWWWAVSACCWCWCWSCAASASCSCLLRLCTSCSNWLDLSPACTG